MKKKPTENIPAVTVTEEKLVVKTNNTTVIAQQTQVSLQSQKTTTDTSGNVIKTRH
ncbi:MAG: hypothetical protein JO072_13945 [Parafilimonas sp.]|nr:hypothetical protein [Parafilimonas sp.]